jgi:hypothetical protein
MVVTDRFKLIWYPVGNRVQLFDLKSDPTELIDLADNPTLSSTKATLTEALISNLYGEDLKWLNSGVLVGEPDRHFEPRPRRGLNGQRGWR